jgi:hypothetical protein
MLLNVDALSDFCACLFSHGMGSLPLHMTAVPGSIALQHFLLSLPSPALPFDVAECSSEHAAFESPASYLLSKRLSWGWCLHVLLDHAVVELGLVAPPQFYRACAAAVLERPHGMDQDLPVLYLPVVAHWLATFAGCRFLWVDAHLRTDFQYGVEANVF